MNATKTEKINLELTMQEALWLKALMQNPLSDDPNPDKEDKEQQEMRYSFFDALNKVI